MHIEAGHAGAGTRHVLYKIDVFDVWLAISVGHGLTEKRNSASAVPLSQKIVFWHKRAEVAKSADYKIERGWEVGGLFDPLSRLPKRPSNFWLIQGGAKPVLAVWNGSWPSGVISNNNEEVQMRFGPKLVAALIILPAVLTQTAANNKVGPCLESLIISGFFTSGGII
jgi:hypothetical protein